MRANGAYSFVISKPKCFGFIKIGSLPTCICNNTLCTLPA